MLTKALIDEMLPTRPENAAEMLDEGVKILRHFSEDMEDSIWAKEAGIHFTLAVAESRDKADQGAEEFRQTCAKVAIELRSLLSILEPAIKDRLPWKATDMLGGEPDVVIEKNTGARIMGPATRYAKHIVEALERSWLSLLPTHRSRIRHSPYPLTIQFVDKDFITPKDLACHAMPDPATADTPYLALHHTGCIYFGRRALRLTEGYTAETASLETIYDFTHLIGEELMRYVQWLRYGLQTTPAADLDSEVEEFGYFVSNDVYH